MLSRDLKPNLSVAEQKQVKDIWAKFQDEDKVSMPESLFDKIKALPASLPFNDDWILEYKNRWMEYVNSTGSKVTLKDYASIAEAARNSPPRLELPDNDAHASVEDLVAESGRVPSSSGGPST